jgi:uncharacterized 2Fe-2S/4Fe-4S cluster protein (DUF4445 family)
VDETAFAFAPREGLGAAVDLGTTTIAAQLVDRTTGAVLAVETAINAQARYGSDLMTRIEAALGGAPLARVAREQVGALVAALLDGADVPPGRLARVVLVGNTAMHHLFGGLDVSPLAAYPFETTRPGALRWQADELGWTRAADAEVVFLPCLGGFVGSDVLAGIRATGLDQTTAPAALCDLGTNGEIVVAAGGQLVCASAAAGPAFEGARISCGMRAAVGAITSVAVEDGWLVPHVLGGGPARGICGSGLVDAVAHALDLGLIQPSGRLAAGATSLPLADDVALTQKDVRELQLAKGALAAGLRLLCARVGVDPAALDRLSLAGAFGNYVSRESALRIGLFDTPLDRVRPAGNTALLGAKLALFDVDPDFKALRRRVVHVPLAAEPGFEDAFADAMAFPDSRDYATARDYAPR